MASITIHQKNKFTNTVIEKLYKPKIIELSTMLEGLGDKIADVVFPPVTQEALKALPEKWSSPVTRIDTNFNIGRNINLEVVSGDPKALKEEVQFTLGMISSISFIRHKQIYLPVTKLVLKPTTMTGWESHDYDLDIALTRPGDDYQIRGLTKKSKTELDKLLQQLFLFEEKLKTLIAEMLKARAEMLDVLASINTLKKLREIWPDAYDEFTRLNLITEGKAIAVVPETKTVNNLLKQYKKVA